MLFLALCTVRFQYSSIRELCKDSSNAPHSLPQLNHFSSSSSSVLLSSLSHLLICVSANPVIPSLDLLLRVSSDERQRVSVRAASKSGCPVPPAVSASRKHCSHLEPLSSLPPTTHDSNYELLIKTEFLLIVSEFLFFAAPTTQTLLTSGLRIYHHNEATVLQPRADEEPHPWSPGLPDLPCLGSHDRYLHERRWHRWAHSLVLRLGKLPSSLQNRRISSNIFDPSVGSPSPVSFI